MVEKLSVNINALDSVNKNGRNKSYIDTQTAQNESVHTQQYQPSIDHVIETLPVSERDPEIVALKKSPITSKHFNFDKVLKNKPRKVVLGF